MTIKNDMVVALQYELKNDKGEVLDSSSPGDPLFYLHGAQNIIPGLEKELSGKSKGDKLVVTVEPAEGYGEFQDSLIQALPKDVFEGIDDLAPGLELQAQEQDGTMRFFTVKEVKEEEVVIDSNHPLAGETLHFKVEVEDVREASKEELEHGHVHSPGHDHH